MIADAFSLSNWIRVRSRTVRPRPAFSSQNASHNSVPTAFTSTHRESSARLGTNSESYRANSSLKARAQTTRPSRGRPYRRHSHLTKTGAVEESCGPVYFRGVLTEFCARDVMWIRIQDRPGDVCGPCSRKSCFMEDASGRVRSMFDVQRSSSSVVAGSGLTGIDSIA